MDGLRENWRMPLRMALLITCAACSLSAPEPSQASISEPPGYATQIEAPSPDYQALLKRPRPKSAKVESERPATMPLPSDAKAVGAFWIKRLERRDALLGFGLTGSGAGAGEGAVTTISTGLTAREFDAWVAENGWTAPAHIAWQFQDELVAPRVSRAAAPRIRFWPAATMRTGPTPLAPHYRRVFVRDGCFYVRWRGEGDKLAWFHAETGLAVDDDGYLVLISRQTGETVARLGEEMIWAGPHHVAKDDPRLIPLHVACGAHEVQGVGNPEAQGRFYVQLPNMRPTALPLPVGPPPGASANEER